MQRWHNRDAAAVFTHLEATRMDGGGYAYLFSGVGASGHASRLQQALEAHGYDGMISSDGGLMAVHSAAPPEQFTASLPFALEEEPTREQAAKPPLINPLRVKGIAAISGQALIIAASRRTLNPFKLFSGITGVISGLIFWRYGSERRDDPAKREELVGSIREQLNLPRLSSPHDMTAQETNATPLRKLDGFLKGNSVRVASTLNFIRSGLFLLAGWKDRSTSDTLCGLSSLAGKALLMTVEEKETTPPRERLDPRRFTDWVQRRPMAMASILEMFSTGALMSGALATNNNPQKLAAGAWIVSDASQFVARKTMRGIDPDKVLDETARMIAQTSPHQHDATLLEATRLLAGQDAFRERSAAAIYESLHRQVRSLQAA